MSQQLNNEFSANQLRQTAVDFMADHLGEFRVQLLTLGWDMDARGELPPNALEGRTLEEVVLSMLRLPWIWGGEESIAALANSLGRTITIYHEGGPNITYRPCPWRCAASNQAPIRLLHRYGRNRSERTHYESIVSWRHHPADPADPADPVDPVDPVDSVEHSVNAAVSKDLIHTGEMKQWMQMHDFNFCGYLYLLFCFPDCGWD